MASHLETVSGHLFSVFAEQKYIGSRGCCRAWFQLSVCETRLRSRLWSRKKYLEYHIFCNKSTLSNAIQFIYKELYPHLFYWWVYEILRSGYIEMYIKGIGQFLCLADHHKMAPLLQNMQSGVSNGAIWLKSAKQRYVKSPLHVKNGLLLGYGVLLGVVWYFFVWESMHVSHVMSFYEVHHGCNNIVRLCCKLHLTCKSVSKLLVAWRKACSCFKQKLPRLRVQTC